MADKKLSVTADQINNSVLNTGSADIGVPSTTTILSNDVVLEKNQSIEVDLSNWLPNDGNPYLVMLAVRATKRTTGNFCLCLNSPLTNNQNVWVLYGDVPYTTTEKGQRGNTILFPVDVDRKINVVNLGQTTTLNRIFGNYYIKIKK